MRFVNIAGIAITMILGGVSVWGLLTQGEFIVFFSFFLISLLAASAFVVLKDKPFLSRKMFVLSGVLLFVATLALPVLLGYSFLEYFVPPFPLFYIIMAFIFFLVSERIDLPTQKGTAQKLGDIYYYIPKTIGSVLLALWAFFAFSSYIGGYWEQTTIIEMLYKFGTLVWIFVFALALLPLTQLIFTKVRPVDKKFARIQTFGLLSAIFLFGVSYLFMYMMVDISWLSSFFSLTLFISLFAIGMLFYLKKYPQTVGLIFICLASIMILASILVLIFIQNPNGNYFFSPLFFFSPVVIVFLIVGVRALINNFR